MIFVTGATGYTGRWVVAELLKRQQDVRCLVRASSDLSGLDTERVSLVTGDLEHVDDWAGELRDAKAVVSVAHIRYAPFVIQACQMHGISRVVFVSSTWRFSKVKTPVTEAVVAGECAVEQSGLKATILRPTMIYGPGNDRNISRLRALMQTFRVMPIFGSGQKLVQPVYVADVAKAIVDALFCEASIGEAVALAGATPLPYSDMVDVISKSIGHLVFKVHIPISVGLVMAQLGKRLSDTFPIQEDQIKRMMEDRAFEIDRAKALWGYHPLSFADGMQAVVDANGDVSL